MTRNTIGYAATGLAAIALPGFAPLLEVSQHGYSILLQAPAGLPAAQETIRAFTCERLCGDRYSRGRLRHPVRHSAWRPQYVHTCRIAALAQSLHRYYRRTRSSSRKRQESFTEMRPQKRSGNSQYSPPCRTIISVFLLAQWLSLLDEIVGGLGVAGSPGVIRTKLAPLNRCPEKSRTSCPSRRRRFASGCR